MFIICCLPQNSVFIFALITVMQLEDILSTIHNFSDAGL